ncbi:molybdopterin synthase sulfur carrier subunit [Archaeoglobales archaeon]|nr:MAG: molybdopterin synthase sulfur carrier subunit [Archaeoglobales archaeon]
MRVKIEFFATLREKYGKSLEVDCDGTLKGALLAASKKLGEEFLRDVFDEKGNYRDDRIILVNGRNIKDEKIENLRENTKISIFPPIAGG